MKPPGNFQRAEVADAVRRVSGVKSVINLITLSAHPSSAEKIRSDIERALVRNAVIDADAIRVRIEDRHAYLTGTARAWSEKQAAEEAAWRPRHHERDERHPGRGAVVGIDDQ